MPSRSVDTLEQATIRIVRAALELARIKSGPLLLAIDGASGSGKSTCAAQLVKKLNAGLIPADDFFAADITNAQWQVLTPEAKAMAALDWRRLRTLVLEPLLTGRAAKWSPFDFVGGLRADGSYGMSSEVRECPPAKFIVLEGAYSTRPELQDLIDLSVLVNVSRELRHRRLERREEASFLAAWHARWDLAEEHYFTQIRRPASFDLVIAV